MNQSDHQHSLILAVDTSQPNLHLALTRGREVLTVVTDQSGLPHSQRLFPLLQESLAALHLMPVEIGALAVNTGPGSFTGLRVGLAAVNGLAATLQKPILGVNALDAAALAVGDTDMPIAILLNASRGEIFWGVRERLATGAVQAIGVDQVATLEDGMQDLKQRFGTAEVILVGNAATENWSRLASQGNRWECKALPASLAPTIAWYAATKDFVSYTAEPYYIRLSEAELKLKQ